MMQSMTGSATVDVDWEAVYLRDSQKKYPSKMVGTPLASESMIREDDQGVTINVPEDNVGGAEQDESLPGPSGVPQVLVRSESRSKRKHKSSPSARKFCFKPA